MRTIIAGSRSITNLSVVLNAIELSEFDITTIISGCARGVDYLGEVAAKQLGIPVIQCPADWDTYGKRAGYIRNEEMAELADALIAIWDGQSRGTKHMIDIAKRKNLLIFIYKINQ